jgi:hypothetical protein
VQLQLRPHTLLLEASPCSRQSQILVQQRQQQQQQQLPLQTVCCGCHWQHKPWMLNRPLQQQQQQQQRLQRPQR